MTSGPTKSTHCYGWTRYDAVTFTGLKFVIFCIFFIYIKSLYYYQFNETINALLSRITINSPTMNPIFCIFLFARCIVLMAKVIFE